jgi:diguanylate cyclase (GGDEF)-like protein/PAS domain S-box-containing protein
MTESISGVKEYWSRYGLRTLLLAVLYFVTAKIALVTSSNIAALFWPPSGIALGFMLLYGWQLWPAVFVGEFCANFNSGLGPVSLVGISAGNVVEVVLACYLLRRSTGFDEALNKVRDVYLLFFLGAALCALLGALNGSFWLVHSGIGDWDAFPHLVRNWWMGDSLGMALFAPALVILVKNPLREEGMTGSLKARTLLMLTGLTVACVLTLGNQDSYEDYLYMVFPFIIWATLSFSLQMVSVALLLVYASSVLSIIYFAPLMSGDMESRVQNMWLFNMLLVITALIVAAVNHQRSHAALALERSENALRRAQKVGKMGSWYFNMRNNRLYWSDETYHIFGIAPGSEMSFERFLGLVYPDDIGRVDEAWQEALQGVPFDIEHRVQVDGNIHWVHQMAEFEFDQRKMLLGATGTVTDITSRREVEDRLFLVAKVFESSGEGILITDLDAHIIAVNKAFSHLSGYSERELLGNNPRMLSSGKHDKEFFREMWETLIETGHWKGEVWDRHKTGRLYPKLMTINVIHDKEGRPSHYVAIASDMSERRESEKKIHMLAFYDVLTGLPNRALLHERLGEMVRAAERDGTTFAVMFMDLDRFKYVNDTLGHAIGDKLLQTVAERLLQHVRDGDTVSRLGGDEFVVVLRATGAEGASVVAGKLLLALAQPYDLDGVQVITKASIGISLYPENANDVESLIKNADVAMYRAKEEGRNNYQFFVPEMNFRANQVFSLEKDIRLALERNEFLLHYQPQVRLADGKICGAEALIRWQHPEKGYVSPADFISVAEETGQIVQIGEWVLETACAQLAEWRKLGMHRFPMAVNLSIRQLRQQTLADTVADVLKRNGLVGGDLELELTEGIMMGDTQSALDFLTRMHEMGVHLSIDDFGTGFSSLNYLKRLPLDKLKIDQSFVRDIETDDSDAAIVRSIISLGHRLNLQVIAEGVETHEQLDFLRVRGCDEIQGYYFSRPLTADKFVEFVKSNPRLD